MSDLDKDFDSIVVQINAKLKEASTVLREVNELREKAGLESLILSRWMREDMHRFVRNEIEEQAGEEANEDEVEEQISSKIEEIESMYDKIDVSNLESELGQAGWSTSSSYC